jgi:hypothetical protein
MPLTHRAHFNEDIARAEAVLEKAHQMEQAGEPARLCFDLRSSAVALAVGALDAYFCDAYVDCLSAVLQAYVGGTWVGGSLPSAFANQELPAGEVLSTARQHRPNWSIRMAARKVMARDNILSLSRLEDKFNGILPSNQKLWLTLVPKLLSHNLVRLTKLRTADLAGLAGKPLDDAKKKVVAAVKSRIGKIIQFRHDWIHNCGRPKSAIDDLSHGRAKARIRDVKILITEFDDHIQTHRLA